MTEDIKYPNFSGKCVSFSLENESSCNDLLDPKFEMQGGRLFVVGIIPNNATTSDWASHCQAAIAWDKVTDYIVFDSEDEFIKASKISEDNS